MKIQSHLCLHEVVLQPAAEWTVSTSGWSFMHVLDGQGYWLAGSLVRVLNSGDVFVVGPAGEGIFRSSWIGQTRLELFRFCPELLGGVLTLGERDSLERFAKKTRPGLWVYPAGHPGAAKYINVRKGIEGENGPLVRGRILQLAMTFFADEMGWGTVRQTGRLTAGDRFKVVADELTEAEVERLSVAELAGCCGCTESHFSRLFFRRFGVSFRTRQRRLRMNRAKQMLLVTDMKVQDVAKANGYAHLGFFNNCFRKEFGMTPTECRRNEKA